jgi:uncharacterized protein (DUF58 family)
METADLLKKVRKIEIRTKGLVSQLFSGEYHTAFKGRGISFSEVREYELGDEIRSIDWNVTARMNHPYVKVFEEERELEVILLVDISRSGIFGTLKQFKRDLITEISAVLAYSAIKNNDKVGVIFFSDKIEKYIPPAKGSSHILRIIRELIDIEPSSPGTDLTAAFHFLMNVTRKKSVVFVLSDFIAGNYEPMLRLAARKHDVVGIHVYDKREAEIPSMGLVNVIDAETGKTICLDTSSDTVRSIYGKRFAERKDRFETSFQKSGADTVSVSTRDNYIRALMLLFERRTKRVS